MKIVPYYILSTKMSVSFFLFFFKIQIFIAIFGISKKMYSNKNQQA